jgi:hypothetical protein
MRDHSACNRPEGKVALLSGAARGTGASVVRDGFLMRYALHGARGARQDPVAATHTPRCLPPRAGPASRTSRWPVNPAGRPAPTPATAVGAVIVYRVARYWVPGAAGAVAAAALTRRHPAPPTARPVTPLSTQTSPRGNALATAGQPHGHGHAALPSPPAVPARQDGRRV